MAIDPLVAAKLACRTSGWRITHLSLQKILYFSHLAFLGKHGGEPLFEERFQAWDLGPVLPSLYSHTKKKGVKKNIIRKSVFEGIKVVETNDNSREFSAIIFLTKKLSNFSSSQLVGWSHAKEGAWKKNYVKKQHNIDIPNEDIKNDYLRILNGIVQENNAQENKIREFFIDFKKEKIKDKLIRDTLIVALDFSSIEKTRKMVDKLQGEVNFFKIGIEVFFQEGGLSFVKNMQKEGHKIFFDSKSLDIPRTVAAAVNSVEKLEFNLMSIHTFSLSLLKHLRELMGKDNGENLKRDGVNLIGVTLLTSMDNADLRAFGIRQTPEEVVLALAKFAMETGKFDGLVASGREVGTLREKYPDAILITPGIRLHGAERHDQRRTTTPSEAIANGADHIVVGRPITQAKDPREVVAQIFEEIEQGVQARRSRKNPPVVLRL